MKILNPAVWDDLHAGRKLRLNLGCGGNWMPGLYSVDHSAWHDLDIQADLNEPLSEIPNDSVSEIYIRHDLDHVSRFSALMMELHRVTKPDGRIEIVVPHFSNPDYSAQATHARCFGLHSFFSMSDQDDQPRHKVPRLPLPEYFRIESFRCSLRQETMRDKLLGFVMQPLINANLKWLERYERRLCQWIPANQIYFILRPKKAADGTAVIVLRQAA